MVGRTVFQQLGQVVFDEAGIDGVRGDRGMS